SLSLAGIVHVGLGEASRGYARLQFERLAAQGAILRTPVEMLLRVGGSLEQFTGFTHLARSLREADPTLARLRIIDERGRLLFSEPPAPPTEQPAPPHPPATPGKRFEVLEDAHSYRVLLPLEGRFGTAGRLELLVPQEAVATRVHERFQPVFAVLSVCLLLQALVLFATQRLWMRRARRWLGLTLGIGVLGMSFITLRALVDLYSEGLQQGTSSLAHSLARRLNEAARMGLTLSDLRGLDTLLEDYQRSNSDLGSLALLADDRVLVHTGALPDGQGRDSGKERFDYAIDLELTDGPWDTPVRLEVSAATGALPARLWGAVRNLLLLFGASALLGLLVLNALASQPRAGPRPRAFERHVVARLQPLAFFGPFLEGLLLAWFAGHVEALAHSRGAPGGGAALLAVTFFGAHALAHLRAERFFEKVWIKPLLSLSLGLSSAALVLMAFTEHPGLLLLLRGLAGLALGALAGGAQAYLLATFPPDATPRGTSLLTPAQHGGLFTGTVCGALLAAHLGSREVFLFAGLCGLIALGYTRLFLPPLAARDTSVPLPRRSSVSMRMPGPARAWRRREHHVATLLVGMPTLMIRGGVLSTLPLLWMSQGPDLDSIGQRLALYALGVLLSHHLVSALPPTGRLSRWLLPAGLGASALGLLALGLNPEDLSTPALGLLGLSHGLIHAPLEAHLVGAQDSIPGQRTSLTLNRLIGGLGQCLGPLLVSALLLVQEEPFRALGGLGVLALLSCAGFVWMNRPHSRNEVRHV
ncbi:MAG: MFS transporter, partial [Cystobacter sp.]